MAHGVTISVTGSNMLREPTLVRWSGDEGEKYFIVLYDSLHSTANVLCSLSVRGPSIMWFSQMTELSLTMGLKGGTMPLLVKFIKYLYFTV